ncbi:MAG: hypothetical protein V2I33_24810 [Kangiellaceae bacterium]|jgi:hypothetical protein|nr:hypothetical protein [Kangiellaceae bacterium]
MAESAESDFAASPINLSLNQTAVQGEILNGLVQISLVNYESIELVTLDFIGIERITEVFVGSICTPASESSMDYVPLSNEATSVVEELYHIQNKLYVLSEAEDMCPNELPISLEIPTSIPPSMLNRNPTLATEILYYA